MRSSPGPPGFSPLDIARAVAVMVFLVLVAGAALERDRDELVFPPPEPAAVGKYPVPAAGSGAPGWSASRPIAAEAGVFGLDPRELAVASDFVVQRPAHPRTLAFARRLRAYPGAPPRVPHGLTFEEFRDTRCNVCHERGGWVARFGTYAPVTPHSDQSECLQCHLPLDELVGRPLPEPGALVCTQCHVDPDRRPATFVDLDWRPASWPSVDRQAMEGSPHVIPHEVRQRNNCLACHGGPGAVADVRTDHPDRTNCRQCHVPSVPSPVASAGSAEEGPPFPRDEGARQDGSEQLP